MPRPRATKDPNGGLTAKGRTEFRRKEPVPKTPAAARKIAEKGRRLLARYRAKIGR